MQNTWLAYAQEKVPRYTSYPTANHFQDNVSECLIDEFVSLIEPDDPLSLYVHIPFCRRLCWFCGCNTSVPNKYDRIAAYVDDLCKEIELWSDKLNRQGHVAKIHFGGGSPDSLSCGDFRKLVHHIKNQFSTAPNLSFDVEVSPNSISNAFIETMASSGVTRVSMGVQTLSPCVQEAINRRQSKNLIVSLVAYLRKLGITEVNWDLLYGLPHQTQEDVMEACDLAIDLGINRVSVFGYAHVPWVAKHQSVIDANALPGLRARFEQCEAATQSLKRAGYQQIGMDHFALPDDSLTRARNVGTLVRNFQGYSDDRSMALIGVGMSAISQFPGGFLQTSKDAPTWKRSIDCGDIPVAKAASLSLEDKVRAEIIEQIMCYGNVDIETVCQCYDFPVDAFKDTLEEVHDLSQSGLCHVNGFEVSVPEEARPFMRSLAARFDAYRVPNALQKHAMAV